MEVDPDQPDELAQPQSPEGGSVVAGSQPATSRQLKLTYEEYRTMANVIVHYLKRNESQDMRKKDIVNWYIEETCSGDSESMVIIIVFVFRD